MSLFGFAFASPLVLLGLLSLPLIWWLLRLTPPRPKEEVFPPTRILSEIAPQEETPAQSPWWLTLLRLLMAALIVFALADPVRNAIEKRFSEAGPMLIVLDDGWTSGPEWEARVASTTSLLEEAKGNSRPVSLIFTSDGAAADFSAGTADEMQRKLSAAEPKPLQTDLSSIAKRLSDVDAKFSSLAWMSSGLLKEGTADFVTAINQLNIPEILVYSAQTNSVLALNKITNQPDALVAEIVGSGADGAQSGTATAYDIKGQSLSSVPFEFDEDAGSTMARFTMPVELRNEIVRVSIDGVKSAGALQLLDERFRRRRVGLISGGNADQAQPLLSPLYYISRALSPFSEVREAGEANVIDSLNQLIEERASTLVLADIGTLPDAARDTVTKWINDGGMLVRFAGPRLAVLKARLQALTFQMM